MAKKKAWIFAKLMMWDVLVLGSALLSGCITAIPKDLARKVDRNISFEQLQKSPTDHQGKLLAVGGVILEAKNTKEGTVLEVLQKQLNYYDRPKDVDGSAGRFLALYKGYLDTAIYQSGREITLVGEVLGFKTQPVGEIEYTYPYLEIRSIFLWEENRYYERPTYIYYPGISPWYYYPYYYYPHIRKDD